MAASLSDRGRHVSLPAILMLCVVPALRDQPQPLAPTADTDIITSSIGRLRSPMVDSARRT